jgi:hypothetical protein
MEAVIQAVVVQAEVQMAQMEIPLQLAMAQLERVPLLLELFMDRVVLAETLQHQLSPLEDQVPQMAEPPQLGQHHLQLIAVVEAQVAEMAASRQMQRAQPELQESLSSNMRSKAQRNLPLPGLRSIA